MERILGAMNSNVVVNAALVGLFGALAVRSFGQQRIIEGLEAEKESLVQKNKCIKNSIWGWKQKLFTEVEANPLVPLSTLKSIYGEAIVAVPPGDEENSDVPAPKIMI